MFGNNEKEITYGWRGGWDIFNWAMKNGKVWTLDIEGKGWKEPYIQQ